MIARNLHDDDFAAFVKMLRIETDMELMDEKRDWTLVRNAVELWEQVRHKMLNERFNVTNDYLWSATNRTTFPMLVADPDMITVDDISNIRSGIIRRARMSPAPESDRAATSSESSDS